MASVLNSKARFYQYVSHENNEADHLIESEADLFIKELSRKQRDTNLTLEKQLSQKKDFTPALIYQPVTERTAGALTYKEFKKISSSCEEKQIQNKNYTEPNETKNISRHVRELALSVKPNSVETKLLEFAISCHAFGNQKMDNRPRNHPINQLDYIQNDLFGHLSNSNNPQQTAKTILRKRKQLLEAISKPIKVKKKPKKFEGKSLWDVTESVTRTSNVSNAKVYSCKKEKLFTIQDGKIIEITKNVNENPAELNKLDESSIYGAAEPKNRKELFMRLGVEDIRKIPRFQNYQEGTPSKILYVKNLSSTVMEEDLELLFAKYQQSGKPVITYNLMKKGKMRGQAFINFHCVKTAARALEETNGVFLRGNPIIIQYGTSHG